MILPTIRVTERQSFKECRRYWYYTSVLDREPLDGPGLALAYGTWIHAALAPWYQGQDRSECLERFKQSYTWYKQRYPSRSLLYESGYDMGIWILEHYFNWSLVHDHFEVLGVEVPLKVRIPGTRTYLVGHVDLLVRQNGRLWVVDHKNFKDFVDPEEFTYDDQMNAYLWLIYKTYGEVPAGAIYNQLLKFKTDVPLVHGGKGLSKDKSYVMPAEIYLQKLHDHGFDPAPYREHLDALAEIEFIRRELFATTRPVLDHFGEELFNEVSDMRSNTIYPNKRRECAYCSMRAPCAAESEGGDWRSVLQLLTTSHEEFEERG